jgi:hypothetical protein
MTQVEQQLPVLTWTEPAGIATRGTLGPELPPIALPETLDLFGQELMPPGGR